MNTTILREAIHRIGAALESPDDNAVRAAQDVTCGLLQAWRADVGLQTTARLMVDGQGRYIYPEGSRIRSLNMISDDLQMVALFLEFERQALGRIGVSRRAAQQTVEMLENQLSELRMRVVTSEPVRPQEYGRLIDTICQPRELDTHEQPRIWSRLLGGFSVKVLNEYIKSSPDVIVALEHASGFPGIATVLAVASAELGTLVSVRAAAQLRD